uniref:Uncharacterized protein n=1 Tax=Arundo donax TaxID=35708 RepID=A0A0A9DGG4_ARUDO
MGIYYLEHRNLQVNSKFTSGKWCKQDKNVDSYYWKGKLQIS